MRKALVSIHILYIFLLVSGSVYGVGEQTIPLGGEASWRSAESRIGVTEVSAVRPYPVLTLSSASGTSLVGYSAATGTQGKYTALSGPALDLGLSFDENNAAYFRDIAGHYNIKTSANVESVNRRFARAGTGAALFHGSNAPVTDIPLIIEPAVRSALFAPGNRFGDFTIEFWLYPINLENGEQILTWVASKPLNGNYDVQRITCTAFRNRLDWSFENFFASTNGLSNKKIEFSGDSYVIPKQWSHHLVRFDATTGMIEYIVDGKSETIVYATTTGRERGEIYTPAIGANGLFVLGERFSGLLDEFKIHNVCIGRSTIQRFANSSGRVETRAVDLGVNESIVLRVNATGGRTSIKETRINNEFRENGRFRFSDDSEMNFFIRASNNPYRLNESVWVSFTPGVDLKESIKGRYVQLAFDFYPSADGETTPYLDEVKIVYMPNEPPMPPKNLVAAAVDGGVYLKWHSSPDIYPVGYFVYYSSVRGELFGTGAALGVSPVNVGRRNSILIEGLKNGTLYYFRVAAYDYQTGAVFNVGEFSKEVTARPLAGLTLDGLP
jgi:hypothetical protein